MQKEKILVIDDEDIILQLSEDILTNQNYEVRTISNGNEGLSLLENEKFDLLLTDIKMPDIGGIDVIKSVRANNEEIPIIVITAYGTLDIAIDALRLGAQGFLVEAFYPGRTEIRCYRGAWKDKIAAGKHKDACTDAAF